MQEWGSAGVLCLILGIGGLVIIGTWISRIIWRTRGLVSQRYGYWAIDRTTAGSLYSPWKQLFVMAGKGGLGILDIIRRCVGRPTYEDVHAIDNAVQDETIRSWPEDDQKKYWKGLKEHLGLSEEVCLEEIDDVGNNLHYCMMMPNPKSYYRYRGGTLLFESFDNACFIESSEKPDIAEEFKAPTEYRVDAYW